MLLSIVAPVYNVEDYLKDFIFSLEKQKTINNYYELILIDDGSTDSSGQICDDLANMFNNIFVIHKENSGLANARNIGLEKAKGKYIFFADSDDLFNKLELKNLLLKLKYYDKDLVIVPFNTLKKDGSLNINSYSSYISCKTILEFCNLLASQDKQLPWAAFQHFISRRFLLKNNLKFNMAYNGAEDLKKFSEIIKCKPNYIIYPNAIMNYRSNREGSINNTKNYSSVMGQLKAYVDAISDFSSQYQIKNYLIKRLFDTLIQIPMIHNKEDQNLCYRFVDANKEVLNTDDLSLKYKIIASLLRKVGLRKGLTLLLDIYKLEQFNKSR